MILDALIALTLISVTTASIYLIGKRFAPKNHIAENQQEAYACGEKPPIQNSKINISLYKYLIYFTIFDSSVLLLAFAAPAMLTINPFTILAFLSMILVSALVVVDGGKE